MKVNKTTILLASALLAIWVGIGFIAYSYVKPGQQPINTKSHTAKSVKDTLEKPFTLLLNYSDPFGNVLPSKQIQNVKPQQSIAPKPVVAKPEHISAKMPNIQYIGLIESNKKKSILVRIDMEEKIFTLADKIGDYSIKKVTSDSIWLAKGKDVQTLGRE